MQRSHWYVCPLLALAALCGASTSADAHPVPRSSHDRTLVVRLDRDGTSERVTVTVAYRLEVDEWTVLNDDMPPFADEVKFADFGRDKLDAFFGEFTRIYAPILARKLRASMDDAALEFTCVKRAHRVRDEQGQLLGHLRCDFEFRASASVKPGKPHRFSFREGNYLLQKGLIDLSFVSGAGIRILDRVAPSVELKKRAVNFQAPGDDDRLREARATFELTTAAAPAETKTPPVAPSVPRPRQANQEDTGLWGLFLDPDAALWVLLLIAAGLGAVHALTPGHGKTLVAAYLIGERGTVWHALLLGLVTTFTHTAAVIVLAVVLRLVTLDKEIVQTGLQVGMGLLVVCLGVWLLLRRLSGKADHLHIGGHGHHHHHHGHPHHQGHAHDHTHADHDHDANGQIIPRNEPVSWWGLILTGMSGGIVPCWDAIAILGVAVSWNKLWLALPLVLAFSAGLASVLVLLGILVVRFKQFATSRWGEGGFVRALPVVSAVVVTLLGFWLCYDAVRSRPPHGHAAARVVESRP